MLGNLLNYSRGGRMGTVERRKEITHVFIFRQGQPPSSSDVQQILKNYSISRGAKVITQGTSQLPASVKDVYLMIYILRHFKEVEGARLDTKKYDVVYSVDRVGPSLERYGVARIVRK